MAGQDKVLKAGSVLCEHPTQAYAQVVVEMEVAVLE